MHPIICIIALLLVGLLTVSSSGQSTPDVIDAEDATTGKPLFFKIGENIAFEFKADLPLNRPAGAKPWVWYAPTLKGRHPDKEEVWMFERFRKAGIGIAGVDVGESFGSPEGRAVFDKLHAHMVSQGYASKPVLLARSRGGLMLYNWAVENPGSVAAVAGIYPVTNLESYPGLEKAAPAYGLTADELKEKLAEHNPIDRLKPLAEAKVPIFHLQGDADKVVPHDDNTAILAKRYKELGGPVEVEIIPGGGHDLWKGWFQSQKVVDFVIKHANAGAAAAGGQAAAEAADEGDGEKPKVFKLPGIEVNLEERYVDLKATVTVDRGYLELIACTKDTKEHESLVMIDAQPRHVHAGLLLLQLNNGNPAMRYKVEEEGQPRWVFAPPRGDAVDLSLVLFEPDGRSFEHPIADFLVFVDQEAAKMAELGIGDEADDDVNRSFPGPYLFTGSHLSTPEEGPRQYLADISGHVITISTFGDEVLGLPGEHSSENGALVWQADPTTLPAAGTKVVLRIRPHKAEDKERADAE